MRGLADNPGMSRFGLVAAVILVAIVAHPAVGAAQCDPSGAGDICAGGSAWTGFTRIRIEPRDRSMPAMTMTVHGADDLSLEVEDGGPKKRPARIVVVDGRAMLMRDVPTEAGFEIDALDGPVLMARLMATLLDQAFPAGPDALPARHAVHVVQKTRAIQVATASAEGRFEAPWRLTGTVSRRDDRIEYDLRFSARTEDGPFSLDARGFWVREPRATPLDESLPLDGWTIHWLGALTTRAPSSTTTDYLAQPAAAAWKDLAALKKWLSEHP